MENEQIGNVTDVSEIQIILFIQKNFAKIIIDVRPQNFCRDKDNGRYVLLLNTYPIFLYG